MNVLIVRLGALGDIIHAIPAAAALRAAFPAARIDWLVDRRHRDILDLVTAIDRVIVLETPTLGGWIRATRLLRGGPDGRASTPAPAPDLKVGPTGGRYDVAIDFQGLMKSAVLARASGARRVLGFSIWHLREKAARPFYSESLDPSGEQQEHVIRQNLRLVEAVGVRQPAIAFPLRRTESRAASTLRAETGGAPFALLNPGAAWPNKRWFTDRFGELAAFLRDVRGLQPFVLWGPGEEPLARAVVESSGGAARLAPATGVADLVELCRGASLMVSGDTGPLHIAAAVGTPIVSIFGPTDPARNGPWAPDDIAVSRFAACGCHYDRRCRQADWCLASLPVREVTAAVQQRLGRQAAG